MEGYNIGIFIYPSNKLDHYLLKNRMVEFTNFYALRLSQNPNHTFTTHIVENINDALSESSLSYDYLILMSAGNRIYNSKDIIPKILSEFESNPSLSLMGHILDRFEEWYELHHQMIVIRTKHWIDSGKPLFGYDGDTDKSVPNIIRSEESFHDGYTPLWVKKGEGETQFNTLRQGWNLLSSLLSSGYTISPFSNEIRRMKGYCYPEYNSEKFYSLIDNKEYSDDIDFTKRVLLGGLLNPNKVTWCFNTEEISILKSSNTEKYNVIALPSAGFKFLDVIKSNLLHDDGKVIFYDFNKNSLDWIEYVLSSNTTNIIELVLNKPNHVRLIGKRAEKLINDNGQPTEDLLNNIREVYEYFGGEDSFSEYLIKFRELDYELVNVDIVNDPLKLTYLLNEDNNLINISNIFSTDFLNLFYTMEEKEKMYNRFIKTLNSKTTIVGRGINTFYDEFTIN